VGTPRIVDDLGFAAQRLNTINSRFQRKDCTVLTMALAATAERLGHQRSICGELAKPGRIQREPQASWRKMACAFVRHFVPRAQMIRRSMKDPTTSSSLVYSTDSGRICPDCERPVGVCICMDRAPLTGDGIVRVSRETKGRAGKCVTLIRGLALDERDLAHVAKELKAACGSGGTSKEGVIELQGEHCQKAIAWLRRRGHTVKQSGS
jgi:translation initiation factor 1